MSIREWKIKDINKKEVLKISHECDIPFICAAILYTRGFKTTEDINKFLKKNDDYESPFDIKDMDKAVVRVKKAIETSEKICIYGDYDADGITATALIFDYLKNKGADVFYYIPSREKEGYGLNASAIDFIKDSKAKLIFTVDNGVSAEKEVEYANSLGIDVVVTDHHRVPEKLPNAVAVVDPYREDCNIEYKNFAGVGVAFKFIQAMEDENDFDVSKYLDLVAIGTIGDSIELTGETRNIVKDGIKNIMQFKRPGINSLIEISGLKDKQISSTNIAFCLVPRINASGRMGDSALALKLLISENEEEAYDFANELNELNNERKEIENEILDSVEELLMKEPERKNRKIIIAEGNYWHHGVLGIVASRIVQKYGKPTILISIDDENATASCRSVANFSIHNLVSMCSQWVERFGGHPMAAGINMKTCNVESFKDAILKNAEKLEISHPKLNIDLNINPSKISTSILNDIDIIKPFGVGNPEPVFLLSSMKLKKIVSIGQGNHTKLIVSRGDAKLEILMFNKKPSEFLYSEGERLDFAVTFSRNEYRGNVTVSIQALDVKLSDVNLFEAINCKKVYEKFKLGYNLSKEELKLLSLKRSDFALVYRYLRLIKDNWVRMDIISQRVFRNTINTGKVYVIVEVLKELGLASVSQSGDEFKIKINMDVNKVNLNDSLIIKKLSGLKGGSI